LSRPEARIRLDDRALARFAAAPKRPSHRGFAPMLAFLSVFLVIAASAGRATRSLSASQPKEMQMKYPLSVMAAAAFATSAFGTDRLVPQQYPTIQSAVDASVNGDRVVVSPGTYSGTVRIESKSIALLGVADAAGNRPRLDGLGATRLIESNNSELLIERFEFFAGNATTFDPPDGGAILARGSGSLIVRHSHFEGCTASTSSAVPFQGGGGAIMSVAPASSATVVEDSTFRGNRAFRGSSLFGVKDIARCRFESGIDTGGAIFSYNAAVVHTVVDSFFTTSTLYMVNTNLHMSGTWRCGSSGIFFEVAGSLTDLGGNMLVSECDCDANRIADAEQLQDSLADRNHDGILDACQCIADISGNGSVDGVDLAAILAAWGSAGNGKAGTDIDGDGIVGGSDLAIVLGSWGPCP